MPRQKKPAKNTALAAFASAPPLLASAASGVAPRLLCLQAHDPDFLDRAIEQMRGAGPDAAIVGDKLEIWWQTQKPARTARRDEAVAALVNFYEGSARNRVSRAASDLCRYAVTGWKRDRRKAALPPETSSPQNLLLFRVMRENGGKPMGFDRIRQIVPSNCIQIEKSVNFLPDPISQKTAHLSIEIQTKDVATMNAMTPHSDQKLLEALRRSPVIEKALTDDAARAIAERKKIIDARADLDRKFDVEFPKLEKAEKSAIADKIEAEKTLRAANDRVNAAAAAKSLANHSYTMESHRLEQILRDGADGKLFAEFRSDMLTELGAARKKYVGGTVTARNRATRKDESVGYNNADSVNRRLSAINAAMEEAEKLRLVADQSGVAERLAALRASLPEIEAPVIPTVHGNGN